MILESLNQISTGAFAAVLNSLWQAVALAALTWLVMRFTPRMNAATRHVLWWAVLAMVVALPAVPAILEAGRAHSEPASEETFQVEPVSAKPVSARSVAAETPAANFAESRTPAAVPAAPLKVYAGAWPLWILSAWAAVLLLQLARIAWSYRYLRQLERRARPASAELRRNFDAWIMSCRVGRPARLLISSEIRSPMAVGFRQPVVMLPEQVVGEFEQQELDHVLLHELAHIARRDDWTNLAARLAGGMLAMHPVAAWALHSIAQEREIACDDWVVSMTGEARPYAASLARLFELCLARKRMMLSSGMAENASHLGKRIEMLLQRSRDFTPRASATRILASATVLVILAAAGAQVPRWLAFAQTPLPPEAPAAAQAPQPPQPSEPPAAPRYPRASTAPAAPTAPALTPLPPEASTPPAPAAPPAPPQGRVSTPRPTPAPPPPAAPAASGSFLAALVAAGYGNLSVDQIIELKNAGISGDFLKGMSETGWGKLSPEELIGLAQRGVNPEYLRQMKAAGLKDLTLKDVMELRSVGARAESIDEIHSLGFGPYTAKEVIQLTQTGLRPEVFRALKAAGFRDAPLKEIIEAQNTGLTARDLREAKQYGAGLTLKQIVKLKMAGVL